ncbi:MAG: hypothetical protein AB1505_15850 [Candidatus Latescibacterota bacterium]
MGARARWVAALLLVMPAGTAQAGEEPCLPCTWGALHELGSIRKLPSRQGAAARLVMGDAQGLLHVLEERGPGFEEVWRSAYLEGAVSGVCVADVNVDDLLEIVVFTDRGRIHYFDAADYHVLWSSPPTAYARFSAHTVANVDDDPQPEFVLCTAGRLVVYDGHEHYEQWRSEEANLATTDILVANVDGDEDLEIVLNDGYVFSARFRNLEWQSPEPFGERLGVLDLDGDGVLEVVGEFNGRFLRVFDIDLRRQKSLER